MKSQNNIAWLLVLTCALLLGVGLVHYHTASARPMPDFSNLPAYITALDGSRVPEMMAIKKEVADGPVALAREEKIAQAAGIPLTLAQIQEPMPPAGQNAAPLYERLHTLQMTTLTNKGLPEYADALIYGYSYTPQQLAAVQSYLSTHPASSSLVVQAAKMPACVFPYIWSNSGGMKTLLFPYLSTLRECARDLNTQSFLLATHGQYANAVTNQALGYHVAQQAEPNQFLINLLVSIAIDAITTQGMKNILYIAGPNLPVDNRVKQAIAENKAQFDLKQTFSSEVVNEMMNMDGLKNHPDAINGQIGNAEGQPPHFTPSEIQFTNSLIDAAEARFLKVMMTVIPAADKPDLIRRAVFAPYNQSDDFDTTVPKSVNPVTSFYMQMTISDFNQIADELDEVQAQRQITMAAAAVLAAKAKTGSLPAILPGQFPDPFGGKQLGYRREGKNGFVVYSVNSDGKFNGGKPGQYKFPAFQMFFRYPGSPLQPVPADELNE